MSHFTSIFSLSPCYRLHISNILHNMQNILSCGRLAVRYWRYFSKYTANSSKPRDYSILIPSNLAYFSEDYLIFLSHTCTFTSRYNILHNMQNILRYLYLIFLNYSLLNYFRNVGCSGSNSHIITYFSSSLNLFFPRKRSFWM